eukprot:jgi/Chlat1/5108/Chrsp33S00389
MRATSPWTEWQLLVLGSFLIHELVFFAAGLPYLALDWIDLPWLRNYKIQQRGTSTTQQWRCVVRLFLYHLSVNLPLMAVSYPAYSAMGITSKLPLPSLSLAILQVFAFVRGADFHDYHHRLLYTNSGNYSSDVCVHGLVVRCSAGARGAYLPKYAHRASAEHVYLGLNMLQMDCE